jgi:hypothetical protein
VRRFAQRCGLIGAAITLHIQLQQQQQQQQQSAQSHGAPTVVHIRSMHVAEFDLVARECLAPAAAAAASSSGGSSAVCSSSSSELSLQLFCELLLNLALRRCSIGATSTSSTITAANSASSSSALAAALYLLSVLDGAASRRASATADVTAQSTSDKAR